MLLRTENEIWVLELEFEVPTSNPNDLGIRRSSCLWNREFFGHKTHQRWDVFQAPRQQMYNVVECQAWLERKLQQRWGAFGVCHCRIDLVVPQHALGQCWADMKMSF